MDNDLQKIAGLMQKYGVVPIKAIQGLGDAIQTRGEAQPKTQAVLTNAGFEWNPDKKVYMSDRGYQTVIAFPQRVYLWMTGEIGRLLQNTNELQSWLAGPSSEFMQQMLTATGMDKPIDVPAAQERPEPPSQEDKVKQMLAKVAAGSRVPANTIIDLYRMAKDTGSAELMDRVKTLRVKEVMKKSQLEGLIREIVRGIFREMTTTGAVSPIATPKAFKKTEEEEEQQITETNTTDGGTSGYQIPGWLSPKGGSKKGLAGSAALGYTLTPIGKKEMNRPADKR
ncbi:hypothetical protein E2P64_06035 [Candidatus Bathyarchaeota archaeon]|nr:hypothetical protein E2P64_06035 [Candidatus Bathyarchaeota archaeon]